MIALYCFSDRGEALGKQLLKGGFGSGNTEVKFYNSEAIKAMGGISNCMDSDFKTASALIFIGATGIAVRAIAPFVDSKFTDPAVLVIDDQGRFVISLLSGHIGGGNSLTLQVAEAIGATPVVTTATDGMGVASMDLILKAAGVPVEKYRDLALMVSSRLLKGEQVALFTEEPERLAACDLKGIQLLQNWEAFLENQEVCKIYIGNRLSRLAHMEKVTGGMGVIPKNIVLGTGSRKDLDCESYRISFEKYMTDMDISPKAVRVLGSIDIKKEEACMQALATLYEMKTIFYTKKQLETVHEAFPKSEQVFKTLGVNGVAAPVAYLMSQEQLIGEMWRGEGCTFAIGRDQTW